MKVLRKGSTGDQVTYLAMLLEAEGHLPKSNPPDEVTFFEEFDSELERAVENFQKQNGLTVDGIVGPSTWGALQEHVKLSDLGIDWDDTTPDPTRQEDNLMTDITNFYLKFGGLVEQLGSKLMVEPAALLAVLAVESAGRGFNPDGTMVIRFENHKLYKYWGQYHQDRFNKYFRFNSNRPWENHQFKHKGQWQDTHDSQTTEHQALALASDLQYPDDPEPAYKSISMGLGQLMGFHYRRCGYSSAIDMYHGLNQSEVTQLKAMVKFILWDYRLITSLQNQDWFEFAHIYNGPGQTQTYGNWMKKYYQKIQRSNILS